MPAVIVPFTSVSNSPPLICPSPSILHLTGPHFPTIHHHQIIFHFGRVRVGESEHCGAKSNLIGCFLSRATAILGQGCAVRVSTTPTGWLQSHTGLEPSIYQDEWVGEKKLTFSTLRATAANAGGGRVRDRKSVG